ncbi:MAG: hypothetical protein RKO24_04825, partial [Candidatus Competibacter sp.]|nr:hypothetical protein [Candidatus Competibacter sp.]
QAFKPTDATWQQDIRHDVALQQKLHYSALRTIIFDVTTIFRRDLPCPTMRWPKCPNSIKTFLAR